VTSTSAVGRRCASTTRSTSRAAPLPWLDVPAVGITAWLQCQVRLLDVRSSMCLPCVRHKVEAAAPAAEPVGYGGTPPWSPPIPRLHAIRSALHRCSILELGFKNPLGSSFSSWCRHPLHVLAIGSEAGGFSGPCWRASASVNLFVWMISSL
jgi:hypothetical protein